MSYLCWPLGFVGLCMTCGWSGEIDDLEWGIGEDGGQDGYCPSCGSDDLVFNDEFPEYE